MIAGYFVFHFFLNSESGSVRGGEGVMLLPGVRGGEGT